MIQQFRILLNRDRRLPNTFNKIYFFKLIIKLYIKILMIFNDNILKTN